MSRFAWLPLYVDDWIGGTCALLPAERGAYLSALLAQWQSGETRGIPDDPARLVLICGGNDFTAAVRSKFQEVKIKGQPYLRNKRLCEIWEKQKAQQDGRSKGGKTRAERYADPPADPPADAATNSLADTPLRARASQIPNTKNINNTHEKVIRASDALFEALAETCGIDWKICTDQQRGALNQTCGVLRKQGRTPEQVFQVRDWWYRVFWKGKTGQAPTPSEIREVWGQAMNGGSPAEPKIKNAWDDAI